jgi:hypothetical protein
MARSWTGTVFWIDVLTVTGIGAEAGFLGFSLEQPGEKVAKHSIPKTQIERCLEYRFINVLS